MIWHQMNRLLMINVVHKQHFKRDGRVVPLRIIIIWLYSKEMLSSEGHATHTQCICVRVYPFYTQPMRHTAEQAKRLSRENKKHQTFMTGILMPLCCVSVLDLNTSYTHYIFIWKKIVISLATLLQCYISFHLPLCCIKIITVHVSQIFARVSHKERRVCVREANQPSMHIGRPLST